MKLPAQWKPRDWALTETVQIMGILNMTPDSFSDGGKYLSLETALQQVALMLKDGAHIIDIGGESTRPGAISVDWEEECRRILPIIQAVRDFQETHYPNARISVDTYKASVAKAALLAGADMINDVWGLQKDEGMAGVAAAFGVPVIAMHNQESTHYSGDILAAMFAFFERTLEIAKTAGVDPSKLLVDPGIGFGKDPDQNLEVLRRLNALVDWGFPVLLGTSRKSTIGKVLDLPPDQRVEGTLATTVLGVASGVRVIRVHDVLENARAVKMTEAIVKGIVPWR